jgi:hypothetical protein
MPDRCCICPSLRQQLVAEPELQSSDFLGDVVGVVELGDPAWASDEKFDRMAEPMLRLFLKCRKELSLLICLN